MGEGLLCPAEPALQKPSLDQPAPLPQALAGWHSGPLLSPSPGDSSPTLPGSRWPWQRKMALVTRTWVSSVPITRRTRRLRSFRAGCMSRGRSDVLACGAWVLAAGGWRLRGRGRAPGWGWGSGRGSGSGGACSAAGAGGARAVLRRASALHIYGPGSGATASRAGLGRRGGGCACFSPRARRVPASPSSAERRALRSSAARPGCSDAKSLLGEGRGRGRCRGTGAPCWSGEGRREGGGQRGGRLGQDVTSKRRGKLNWARQLHPGGLWSRRALETRFGDSVRDH